MKQQTALEAAADVLCSTRSKAAANGARIDKRLGIKDAKTGPQVSVFLWKDFQR
jgi:hypothetical protein